MYLPGDLASVAVDCAVWTGFDYRLKVSDVDKDEVIFILSRHVPDRPYYPKSNPLDSDPRNHSYYVITSNAMGWMWGPNLRVIVAI